MEFVFDQRKVSHLAVGHLDPLLVYVVIEFGSNGQPGASGGPGDQVHHDLTTFQDSTAPVHGDVTEQPMFYLVPLRRPGWKVAHDDVKPGVFRECRDLSFPQPSAGTV
jgi:hypothetical protein